MPVISLKGRFMLIFLLYFNVVKSYREIKTKEPVRFNNPLLYLYNK